MFKFKAIGDDGEELVFQSDSRDVANWERVTKGATMGQLGADDGANLSFTALYVIAWFAAKRLGLIGSFTEVEFRKTYALELVDDEVKPDDEEGVDEAAAELNELEGVLPQVE